LIAGRHARLARKIEERYGVAGDEAERRIKTFAGPISTRVLRAFAEHTVVGAQPLKPSRAPSEGSKGDMPRILIVDDDVAAADALAALVQSLGYGDARVAHTAATALALAVEFVPTVLLVDLDLPDMTGYDVARHLSQHPQLQNLRLIALTTSSEHPGRELAREAGIERYLIKPVGSADLAELFT
jgi:CheY-like chemotaxis protein